MSLGGRGTQSARNGQAQPRGRRVLLRHVFVYAVMRMAFFLLALPPLGSARRIGARLGDLIRLVDRRHRRITETQVAERLGLGPEETRDFVKRNFRHYGMLVAEVCQSTRMSLDGIRRLIDEDSLAEMRKTVGSLLAEGRGLIIISAHYGNWEWSILTSAWCGYRGAAMARRVDNPLVDAYFRRQRERAAMRIIDKGDGYRAALRILAANDCVAVLSDQDSGKRAMLASFLGKPASTITIPAEMAMRTGAPMLVSLLRRIPERNGASFCMRLSRPIRANPGAEPNAEARRLVEAMNAGIEAIIREDPVQWFWAHRRWKNQDVQEKNFRSARSDPVPNGADAGGE